MYVPTTPGGVIFFQYSQRQESTAFLFHWTAYGVNSVGAADAFLGAACLE